MKTETTRAEAEPLHFCTIVSKNHLAHARALAESLRTHHPDSRLHVLLVDKPEGCFDPNAEPFAVVPVEDIFIPNTPRFCFQYNLLEVNTAAKPYFLAHLLKTAGCRKLVYLDADVLVLRAFDDLPRLLDLYNVVLTPHLTEPLPLDGKRPDELDVLLQGRFNLGFVAVAAAPETDRLLEWWRERVYAGCRIDKAKGLFLDRKWMDLAPMYFDGVHVLRRPGYNIGHWKLCSRMIEVCEGEFWIGDEPAYCLHFSGFDPARPTVVSRDQNRLGMEDLGEAAFLFAHYAERLRAHGHDEAARWPYAYGAFDNGAPIPDAARLFLLDMGEYAQRFDNPFMAEGERSFFHWLSTPKDGGLPPILEYVYRKRPDVMRAFPDAGGKGRAAFLGWADARRQELKEQFNVAGALLEAALGRRPPETRAPKPAGEAIRIQIRKGGKKVRFPFGVNLAGFLESEKGLGEAARSVIRAVEAVGIPHVLNNFPDGGSKNVEKLSSRYTEANPYAVNLLQVNADAADYFMKDRPEYLAGKYNIGCWNWELPRFPDFWKGSFDYFDEIWAPSVYTQQSIAGSSPIPVRCVPFSIAHPTGLPPCVGRGNFGVPTGAFLFLFAYDFHSYIERKNPFGLVNAFVKAFGDRTDVGLVLKTMHVDSRFDEYERLLDVCRGRPNIHLLNQVYTRVEAMALMQLCDAYASLHRSEGFGLTIAEAMARGKPVVATGYSSNVDFMTAENSRPIRYRLIELERDHGPYEKGQLWADPDLDHAAHEMRRLVEEPALARRLGEQARRDVAERLSPAAVGRQILSTLAGLQNGEAAVAPRPAPGREAA